MRLHSLLGSGPDGLAEIRIVNQPAEGGLPFISAGGQEAVLAMGDGLSIGADAAVHSRDTQGTVLQKLDGALAAVEQVVLDRGDKDIDTVKKSLR